MDRTGVRYSLDVLVQAGNPHGSETSDKYSVCFAPYLLYFWLLWVFVAALRLL